MNRPMHSPLRRQHGIAAVEFAMVFVILFTLVFGVMEIARMAFVWNTLTQATNLTARGAASLPFKSGSLDTLRQQAIFAGSLTSTMPMTNNIKYGNLFIDYLNASRNPVASAPTCQVENLLTCTTNPSDDACVRFVRVRVCDTGSDSGNCVPVPYKPVFLLPAMAGLSIKLPPFTAIMPLEAQTTPGKCT